MEGNLPNKEKLKAPKNHVIVINNYFNCKIENNESIVKSGSKKVNLMSIWIKLIKYVQKIFLRELITLLLTFAMPLSSQ